MKIEAVMTKEVESCQPHTPIHAVSKKMKELDVGVMPICEQYQLVGLATDRDLVVNAVAAQIPLDSPISKS
ncbi:CBS domain-containing protein [Mesobacillus zeae]|uniref:CBS domain-containing protein n=1 Tax=Mesobacillus zeae TaxID=1917180 RepID=A0A398B7C9_9BACI|nr:CBS domain-containing protein [Mesobacillus zeae]RID85865.1 CBS domain-containing protein [Mesobacillus zeae]